MTDTTSAQMTTANETSGLPTQTVNAVRLLLASQIRMHGCVWCYAQQLYEAGTDDSEPAQTKRKKAREEFAGAWVHRSQDIQQAEHQCVEAAADVLVTGLPTMGEVFENVAQVVQPSQESPN